MINRQIQSAKPINSGFEAAKKITVQTLERKKVGPILQRLSSMTQHENISPVLISRLVAMDVEWSAATIECANQELFLPSQSHCANLYQAFNNIEREKCAFVAQCGAIHVLARFLLEDSELNPADFLAHVATTTRLVWSFCTNAGHPHHRIAPACLFHDIGFLALAAAHPQTYSTLSGLLSGSNQTLEEFEKEKFGTTHNEVGRLICMALQFDDLVTGAVSDHHHNHNLLPWSTQAVRLADAIAAELGCHLGIGVTNGANPQPIEGIELDEGLIIFAGNVASQATKAAKLACKQEILEID